ncbi:MAG: glycosylhydrolase-like jelly roll fold domain-containing protein [Janthinobacterium lividum]
MVSTDHKLQIRAWKNGQYQARMASGKLVTRQITAIPSPREITGPWTLTFPPHSVTPPQVMASLRPWGLSKDPRIQDFSGTATYRTTFTLPVDIVAKYQAFALNLGDVQVIADVTLNGKYLGIFWKAPYTVDISQAVKPGVNTLQVKVTNLWVNRMIGDDSLPPDSDRNGDGTLKSWPQWVLDGKTSPTGRTTFTSWQLWNKDSPRQPSGMLGPVTLSAAKDVLLSR